jgi:hypothetical protein
MFIEQSLQPDSSFCFRTLVDTVYTLKDQIKELQQEQKRLRRDLDCESRARKRLEISLRKSVRHLVEQTCDDVS